MPEVVKNITTQFGEYTVVHEEYNDRPARMLLSKGNVPQSGVGLDNNPEQLFAYTQRLVELAVGVKPHDALVLGGGGFTVPTALARQLGSSVDAVEIDIDLTAVARDYFQLASEAEGLTVVADDATSFIRTSQRQYDYIVVDVFQDRTMPEGLMTAEAAMHYSRLLRDTGVLAFNCISRYHTRSDTLLKKLIIAMKGEFRYSGVYPADVHNERRSSQNLIVVFSRHTIDTVSQYMQSYPVTVLGVDA